MHDLGAGEVGVAPFLAVAEIEQNPNPRYAVVSTGTSEIKDASKIDQRRSARRIAFSR
jgi:hypothetical protein